MASRQPNEASKETATLRDRTLEELLRLIFEQIRAGGDRNFGYLLADRDAGCGVLIDPSYSPETFVRRAADQRVRITHVVNTHSHPDHTNGNAAALEQTGATLAAHPDAPTSPGVRIEEGHELRIGAMLLRVLHVPGHCADHVALYEPNHQLLITGDLLFVGKVGGTQSESEARVEWESLQRVVRLIPGEATVWPGHDYGVRPSSTIALERATNPFLLCTDVGAFLELKEQWAAVKARYGLV